MPYKIGMQKTTHHSASREKGNVLFLILIAVALFAALSYAITRSGRNSANNGSSEKVQADMARVLNYLALAQVAAQRLLMNGGCTTVSYYNNQNDPCNLVAANGGRLLPIVSFSIEPWAVSTGSQNVAGIGTVSNDLILSIPARYNKQIFLEDVCMAVNKRFGVPGNPSCPTKPPLGGMIFTNTPAAGFSGFHTFCWANTDRCDYSNGGNLIISTVLKTN